MSELTSRVDRLLEAHARYLTQVSPVYDEVLQHVARRIADSGAAGKADIGSLVLWKRIQANTRWAAALNMTPDVEVRRTTGIAIHAASDLDKTVPEAAHAARVALRSLPGFNVGFSLASALLVAAAPSRMAVYDRRAHIGLGRLGVRYLQSAGYSGYMARIEDLRTEVNGAQGERAWTARDVDLALFSLGG